MSNQEYYNPTGNHKPHHDSHQKTHHKPHHSHQGTHHTAGGHHAQPHHTQPHHTQPHHTQPHHTQPHHTQPHHQTPHQNQQAPPQFTCANCQYWYNRGLAEGRGGAQPVYGGQIQGGNQAGGGVGMVNAAKQVMKIGKEQVLPIVKAQLQKKKEKH